MWRQSVVNCRIASRAQCDAEGWAQRTPKVRVERCLLPAVAAVTDPKTMVLRVTIVGENTRTIESLQRYLISVGVESLVMRQLPDGTAVAALGDALVVFPDDFNANAVLATIKKLQQSCPLLQLLLVTSAPQRFQDLRTKDARPPILLAKPAFGWAILDAVRASAVSREESY